MSLAQILIVLICGGGLFLILAVGAWVLINKSKLDAPENRESQIEALDREYATGDLDKDEYDRRRARIMNDRMR